MDAAGQYFSDDDLDMVVALAGCSLDESPGKNWVERSGGLPEYICRIARAIKRSGKSTGQAIAIAVSRVKKWAAGADDVDADTRAKAAAAVAQWEKLKAKNRSKSAAKDVKASGPAVTSHLSRFVGLGDPGALDRIVTFASNAQKVTANKNGAGSGPPPFAKTDGGPGKTTAPSGLTLTSAAAVRAAWTKHKDGSPALKARIRAAAKKFNVTLSE